MAHVVDHVSRRRLVGVLGLLGAAFVFAAWLAVADGSTAPGAVGAAMWLGAALRWA